MFTGEVVPEEFYLFTAMGCRNPGFNKCTIWQNYPALSYRCVDTLLSLQNGMDGKVDSNEEISTEVPLLESQR
jgi:hypothetical protein